MISKKGTVVKISGEKTVRVQVHTYKNHEKYKKRFRETAYFLAHDEKGALEGATVMIEQSLPRSKKKSWEVVSIVEQGEEMSVDTKKA